MIGLSDYIQLQIEQKDAILVTPQSGPTCDIKVYKFTKDNVERISLGEPKCGVYLIGVMVPRMYSETSHIYHEFRVCYFGRSDKDVASRLHDHLVDGGKTDELHIYDSNLYFALWICDDPQEAYDKECKFYDSFFCDTEVRCVANGYKDSIVYSHDVHEIEKNKTKPQPYVVYVDNSNKPGQPQM